MSAVALLQCLNNALEGFAPRGELVLGVMPPADRMTRHRLSTVIRPMGKPRRRFVPRAEKNVGWRIWDQLLHRFGGPVFPQELSAVVAELNAGKSGERLNKLFAAAKRADK